MTKVFGKRFTGMNNGGGLEFLLSGEQVMLMLMWFTSEESCDISWSTETTHSDPLNPSLDYGGIFGTRSDPILQGGFWFVWYKWQWQSVLTLSPGLSHNDE